MNKQLVAAMMLGAALGVGGEQAAKAVFSGAEAAGAKPNVHAADLRRAQSLGAPVVVTAYGWLPTDGGVRDIGQAKKCKPTQTAEAFMNSLDCEW